MTSLWVLYDPKLERFVKGCEIGQRCDQTFYILTRWAGRVQEATVFPTPESAEIVRGCFSLSGTPVVVLETMAGGVKL